MDTVFTGLENFLNHPPVGLSDMRLGLLCNPSSIDRQFCHARKLISKRFPGRLKALYSPQHGFFAEKQDNMIESDHILESSLNIPIFSLYGQTRCPTEEMFDSIDTLVIDLQDAGTRVYTFIYTMSYCMEAAKRYGKQIILLDRPNPINGINVEGNLLSYDCISFVGRYPIPMRHGLTIGEVALFFNDYFDINCELTVIPLKGWRRCMYFNETKLPWVAPSPNLPTYKTAMVYPGQVLWEGTNVSEGRGTCLPFELFGAPFIQTNRLISLLGGNKLPGAILRTHSFEPTSNKWKGKLCHGFQIHITDPREFKPYQTSLRLLQAVIRCHKNEFTWKSPPYEYEYNRLPIDLITGSKELRYALENLDDLDQIFLSWKPLTKKFIQMSRKYHLYS